MQVTQKIIKKKREKERALNSKNSDISFINFRKQRNREEESSRNYFDSILSKETNVSYIRDKSLPIRLEK